MYTQELADAICERLAAGEPLAQICRDKGMPSDRAVRYWADPNSNGYKGDEFASAIAQARARGFDAIAESCLEIADDARNDWMERLRLGGEGGERPIVSYELNGEHVQRSKLRIETRLKLLAKWDPKRYGDKLTTEVTGNVKHDHTVGLSGETAQLLDSLKAGPGGAGDAAPVPD